MVLGYLQDLCKLFNERVQGLRETIAWAENDFNYCDEAVNIFSVLNNIVHAVTLLALLE